jgi:hypothetical protein
MELYVFMILRQQVGKDSFDGEVRDRFIEEEYGHQD